MRKAEPKKVIVTALFAALSCAATMVIRIPIPGGGGYIHPGDAVVILSGIILGPVYGSFAAGIGSALADILSGYLIYAPVTLVIKALSACAAGIIFRTLKKKNAPSCVTVILGGLVNAALVTVGYFLYEIPLYGISAAVSSSPANLIQGAGGILIAAVLFPIISAIPDVRRSFADLQTKTGKRQ